MTVAILCLLALGVAGCGKPGTDAPAGGKPAAPAAAGQHPGTEAGAKAMLAEFLQPGADRKALSQALRPTKDDYAAVFDADFGTQLMNLYEPAWQKGELVLKVNEGQTEVLLHAVPSAEVKAWSKAAADHLPGGYEKIKDHFQGGHTVYAFKFVKPGEELGMAYDGLVHVNNHWCLFPKPYRAVR